MMSGHKELAQKMKADLVEEVAKRFCLQGRRITVT
jgi:hypothetical protein